MLTFFRRIRKELLESGTSSKLASPTGRYFLYAVGEILLVMIGILLALQVNNWNEWRKERILEDVVLEDITDNIIRNHELINNAISTIDKINLSTKVLINSIQSESSYSDTLAYHINEALRSGTFLFKLNSDGYASLKNTGFSIIQNEELKDEILSLFEVTYGYLLTTLQFANSLYFDNYSWWKEYMYKSDLHVLVPYNKDAILKDKGFITEINEIAFLRSDFKKALKESLTHSQEVLMQIQEELGKNSRREK